MNHLHTLARKSKLKAVDISTRLHMNNSTVKEQMRRPAGRGIVILAYLLSQLEDDEIRPALATILRNARKRRKNQNGT